MFCKCLWLETQQARGIRNNGFTHGVHGLEKQNQHHGRVNTCFHGRQLQPSEQQNLQQVISQRDGHKIATWTDMDMKALPFWTTWIILFVSQLNHWMLTDLQGDLYLLLGKKSSKQGTPKFQPTNKAKVKGFQLCINQSSCATSLSRGAWQHEYGLDSTEYLNAYAYIFHVGA